MYIIVNKTFHVNVIKTQVIYIITKIGVPYSRTHKRYKSVIRSNPINKTLGLFEFFRILKHFLYENL